MEIMEFFQLVRRRVRMVILISVSAVVSAYLLTYMIPEKYEAMTLVLVKPQENIKLSTYRDSKELLDFPVSSGAKAEVPSNTYIGVIKSQAIAEKVVRFLRLDEKTDPPAVTASERLLASIRAYVRTLLSTTIQLLKYGRVIGDTPPFEAAVEAVQENISLNAIKDTYLFEINYAADDPQEAASVANAVADLFLKYMVEIDEPVSQSTLSFLHERFVESETHLTQARQVLQEAKEQNKTVIFNDQTNAEIKVIAELESALEKAEIKLAGLLKKFTPLHPQVQIAQAEKERLLVALEKRKERLTELPNREKVIADLKLKVDEAEDIHQIIKKEYEEARVRAGKGVSEIRVASPAVPPMYPSRPIRAKYAIVALLMALLLSVVSILVSESLKNTIERLEQVERVLQLPVLATVPLMKTTLHQKK